MSLGAALKRQAEWAEKKARADHLRQKESQRQEERLILKKFLAGCIQSLVESIQSGSIGVDGFRVTVGTHLGKIHHPEVSKIIVRMFVNTPEFVIAGHPYYDIWAAFEGWTTRNDLFAAWIPINSSYHGWHLTIRPKS